MRRLLLALSFGLASAHAAKLGAQAVETGATRPANAMYFELFGNGGLYSLNAERRVFGPALVRVGASRWSSLSFGDGTSRHYRFLIVMLSAITGNAPTYAEFSAGVRTGSFSTQADVAHHAATKVTTSIASRHQPRRGVFYRLAIVPEYSIAGYDGRPFSVSFGASIGFGF